MVDESFFRTNTCSITGFRPVNIEVRDNHYDLDKVMLVRSDGLRMDVDRHDLHKYEYKINKVNGFLTSSLSSTNLIESDASARIPALTQQILSEFRNKEAKRQPDFNLISHDSVIPKPKMPTKEVEKQEDLLPKGLSIEALGTLGAMLKQYERKD